MINGFPMDIPDKSLLYIYMNNYIDGFKNTN